MKYNYYYAYPSGCEWTIGYVCLTTDKNFMSIPKMIPRHLKQYLFLYDFCLEDTIITTSDTSYRFEYTL